MQVRAQVWLLCGLGGAVGGLFEPLRTVSKTDRTQHKKNANTFAWFIYDETMTNVIYEFACS